MPNDFDGVRICNVPDHLGASGDCQWPDPELPWAITAVPPGMEEEDYRKAIAWALATWATAGKLSPREIETAAKARILAGCRRIDGPSGVLAECELPCGSPRQCRMWLDSSDSWDTTWPPTDRQKIPAYLTILHELGHGLGISHAPPGTLAVMSPSLQSQLRGLQPWDIAEARRRYGPPVSPPPVPTPPGPLPPTPIPGGDMGDFFKVLIQLFTFLSSNPELLEFFKRIIGRSLLGERVTMEQVREEATRVEQLRLQ